MAAMKTMFCWVLDAGRTMATGTTGASDDSTSNPTSKLDIATAFIGSMMTQKMISSKTTEFGMYTYGDDVTNNYLNTTQGEDQYTNVNEIFAISRPGSLSLQAIRDVRTSDISGDLIDGIVVAQDALVRTNEKYKFNRVMVLFTDGETEVSGIEDMEQIVSGMRMKNCLLFVGLIGKVNEASSSVKRGNAALLRDIALVSKNDISGTTYSRSQLTAK
jgi:hypothetical protein